MAITSLVMGPKDPTDTLESFEMPTGSKKAPRVTTPFLYSTYISTLFKSLKRNPPFHQSFVAKRFRWASGNRTDSSYKYINKILKNITSKGILKPI